MFPKRNPEMDFESTYSNTRCCVMFLLTCFVKWKNTWLLQHQETLLELFGSHPYTKLQSGSSVWLHKHRHGRPNLWRNQILVNKLNTKHINMTYIQSITWNLPEIPVIFGPTWFPKKGIFMNPGTPRPPVFIGLSHLGQKMPKKATPNAPLGPRFKAQIIRAHRVFLLFSARFDLFPTIGS